MRVSITIDTAAATDAERYAEIRRLLILVDLLAAGCELGAYDEHVTSAVRAATRNH